MAKILYVEDDTDLSGLMVRWLQIRQHTVQLVATGYDALEYLEFDKYDLIILDNGLPDLDGLSVCRTFRKKNRVTPIIMLTGRPDANLIEDSLKAGANQVLAKPPNMKELAESIALFTGHK